MNVLHPTNQKRLRERILVSCGPQRRRVSNIGVGWGPGRRGTPLTRPSRTPLGIFVQAPDNITHWR